MSLGITVTWFQIKHAISKINSEGASGRLRQHFCPVLSGWPVLRISRCEVNSEHEQRQAASAWGLTATQGLVDSSLWLVSGPAGTGS